MTVTVGQDLSKTRKTLTAGGQTVSYYSIPAAEAAGLGDFAKLPASLKVVLENMLRFEDGKTVTVDDIKAFSTWGKQGGQNPIEAVKLGAAIVHGPHVFNFGEVYEALDKVGGSLAAGYAAKSGRSRRAPPGFVSTGSAAGPAGNTSIWPLRMSDRPAALRGRNAPTTLS